MTLKSRILKLEAEARKKVEQDELVSEAELGSLAACFTQPGQPIQLPRKADLIAAIKNAMGTAYRPRQERENDLENPRG